MRLLALIILVIPAVAATLGIKLIRDTLFGITHPIFFHISIQLIAALVFLIGGIAFIGGFIRYRDKKRKSSNSKY
ncbi:DUF2627 domain-containing protein [Thalassobacillus pellis]|uniref:DUF2627 domain-containing protein n=1 Tax=Thalassobacillus pellis TaxID=748008 RepID=UPI001961057F|nr:DUF2627 domain-containing protein [Thalassobacillus pellis]MBM7552352.1 hypothetical protein [Thalassobacillus pellis]